MYRKIESDLKKRWVGDMVEDGTWAKLCVDDNEVCFTKAECGNIALGQVTSIMRTTGDPPGPYLATVDCSRGVIITSLYDKSQRYPVNAHLFVVDGTLTTNYTDAQKASGPHGEPLSIGLVTETPRKLNGDFLEFLRL